ncbi:MAG: hypothetical protein SFY66_26485 [Oculatellaceae cyanobacterium bins.114]|nr:hypothetical protein [Oculatellaceae cyanobacterium bins.114]
MARLKRNSAVLDKALLRMAGMRSIHETLEFGNGLSLVEYDTHIQALQTQLLSYNTMLSTLDEMAGRLGLMEQELRSYSEKMLMSVATRYGKDSLQYMQAGGKARKRLTRSTSSLAASPAMTPTVTTSTTTNGNGASVAVN